MNIFGCLALILDMIFDTELAKIYWENTCAGSRTRLEANIQKFLAPKNRSYYYYSEVMGLFFGFWKTEKFLVFYASRIAMRQKLILKDIRYAS